MNQDINFDRFIALGDSITAGYKDGALVFEGQLSSFPNLLARQIGCDLKQPLVPEDSPGIGFFGNSQLILEEQSGQGSSLLGYKERCGDVALLEHNIYANKGPFGNLGVPGAKVTTLLYPGYGNREKGEGNYNPFFFRVAKDPATSSVLSDAMQVSPSFFTLFIGNNDVLAYALSGGTSDSITPLNGETGTGFEKSLEYILNELTSAGAKGVVSNLPALSSLPFFKTIPYNSLLLDTRTADLLNSKNPGANTTYCSGYNTYTVEDKKSGKARQIDKQELILLDVLLDANKEVYMKGEKPIPKRYYLTMEEIECVNSAIIQFNKVIEKITLEKKLAFVDINCLLQTMKTERIYNSISRNVHYNTGGVFSLDGLHVNSLGQAILANEFINSINTTYGTQIEKVVLTRFR
ncbi:MAG: hypothetical protein H0W61_12640 [Bacteroidetes bacterium]|nr:hypothetical protein [Bacteroidota bacterium]